MRIIRDRTVVRGLIMWLLGVSVGMTISSWITIGRISYEVFIVNAVLVATTFGILWIEIGTDRTLRRLEREQTERLKREGIE